MSKKLSILTVTLESRSAIFQSLVRILESQYTKEVELLANIDKGEKSIGQKRNELLQAAKGEYVAFLDDDDQVSPYYITSILQALESKPDCVGLEGIITLRNQLPKKFIHSIKYQDWFEKDNIYYRCPNHLNPIKKSIALDVGFLNVSYQEDKDFSFRLKGKLHTENYIDFPIYFYYPSTTG
jgi:glycosyltransferase involved in cell wall biosynthesis